MVHMIRTIASSASCHGIDDISNDFDCFAIDKLNKIIIE